MGYVTITNPKGLPPTPGGKGQVGNLGLTDAEENDLVAFLQILSDGFTKPNPIHQGLEPGRVRRVREDVPHPRSEAAHEIPNIHDAPRQRVRHRRRDALDPATRLGEPSKVVSVTAGPVMPLFNLGVARDRTFFVGRHDALVHDNTPPDPRLEPFDAGLSLAAARHGRSLGSPGGRAISGNSRGSSRAVELGLVDER